MARAIWSGALTFGLVNIPVKLASAVTQKEVRFHMLHDKDGGRIHLKRFCAIEDKEVPYEHIVKGYEVSKGRYVSITPEELEAFAAKAARTIEIHDFVDQGEIDPIYYDRTYYLVPEASAAKAYALLIEAMRGARKVALATFVLRTRESLCSVRPIEDALALSTMNRADEIIPVSSLDLPSRGKPSEREVKMAEQLVESLSAPFQPERYPDVYRERVLELVHRKAEGETIEPAAPEERPAEVVSLADALSASLAAARRRPDERGDEGARRPRQHADRGAIRVAEEEARVTARSKGDVEVDVAGRRIVLKNLDKVFYPEAGFTKGDVLDYYARIAPVLLPHLAERPLTLKRYPNGVDAPFFYEKRCPRYRPAWLRTEAVWSEANGELIDYCVVDDVASLVWLASIADLELHTSLSHARTIERPTALVFDLDPGPPADLLTCCDVALRLRRLLGAVRVEAFPKTSGSKGLQVYAPLNVPVSYDETKAFAHAVARLLERAHPDLVVERMNKDLRRGKVLVDWSQNDPHKTTVCVYSLRARPRPTVSTPVSWAEVERAFKARDAARLVFEAKDVLRRVERKGDLFAPVLTLGQRLPSASGLDRASLR